MSTEIAARPIWAEVERDVIEAMAAPWRSYWRDVAAAGSYAEAERLPFPGLPDLDRALANAIRAGYSVARAETLRKIERDLPGLLRRRLRGERRRPRVMAAGGDAAAQATAVLVHRLTELTAPEEWIEYYAGNRIPPLTWALQEKARRELAARVAAGAAQGLSWRDIKAKLRETYQLGWPHAENVARTELATMYSHGSLLHYGQTDIVRNVQFMAVLDSRTTKICARLNGKVFAIGAVPHGVTPPLHYQCRSTLSPVLAWEKLRATPLEEVWAGAAADELPLEGFGTADLPPMEPYSISELLRPDLASAKGEVRAALQWLARGPATGWWL